jgi:putative inorganic carbon (hco3(-)) transporter
MTVGVEEPDQRQHNPLRSPVAAGAAGLVLLCLALAAVGQPRAAVAAFVAVPFLVAAAYLVSAWVTPAVLISLTVAAASFSGHWRLLGSPLPLDRVLFVFALALVGVDAYVRRSSRVIRWRPIHFVLGVLLAYVALSGYAVGTLTTSSGFFAFLDRLGLVPVVVFTIAGLAFPDRASRNVLLVVLVALGGYLAATAILEGLGLAAYTWPSYIDNPNVGIQFGRARGPFVESVAMGLALFDCAVAAVIASLMWVDRRARLLARVVAVACLVGVIPTLTRSIWIGTALAVACIFLVVPALRRWLLPAAVVGTAAVVTILLAVPGLGAAASRRAGSQSPIWDRLNTNRAAFEMLQQHPLFGIGWDRFTALSSDYLRQGPNYPLTGIGIEVHNVLLSHATELGIVGATLWLLAILGSVGHAIIRRPPPELVLWRYGLLAIAIEFAVVAAVGPLSYALPNMLLWLWAGIVLTEYLTEPREPEPVE